MTGPTVVGPLVRNPRLRPRLQTVLEAEGVFIDPIGALLAVLVLQITLAADASQAAAGMRDLAARLAFGLGLGVAGGFGLAYLLRLTRLVHGLENILVLGLVTLRFHVGEHVLSQTGLIAVTAAGVVVGNFESRVVDDLREFKDQLTLLLIGTIFVLLAADVGLNEVRALGWNGLGVVLTLILIVRPLSVVLVTRGAGLSARETAFVAAVAPRGIVAAAIASLMAGTVTASGIAGGADLRALVFLVIAGTVVAAGVVAWPLAAALGLRLPARDRVLILGAQGLGLALATKLKAGGAMVTLIDADPQRCRRAEDEGFSVVYGDGLQERTLRRARVELVGTIVGATFNDHLNSQFVRYAQQEFDVPRGLVSVGVADKSRPPEHVVRHGADVLFDGPHDQVRWDMRWRQDEVSIETFEFQAPPEGASNGAGTASGAERPPEVGERRSDTYVVLALQRNRRVAPMAASAVPRAGDCAGVAIYSRARDQALAELGSRGWRSAPESRDAASTAAPVGAG